MLDTAWTPSFIGTRKIDPAGSGNNSEMGTADRLGLEHRLAVYGTLAPGRSNAHVLYELSGTWTQGSIRGHLHERGWGIYPGVVLDDSGPEVAVHVFASRDLPAHWQRLDEFEGSGYRRVSVSVSGVTGEVAAYVYTLVDDPARGTAKPPLPRA